MVKKPRCTFKECGSAAQRIVGDCGFCEGHFCAKHRLLEDHKCTGLEDVSDTADASSLSSSSLLSSPPSPSISSPPLSPAKANFATPWWLVGLSDILGEDEMGGLIRMASPETTRRAGDLVADTVMEDLLASDEQEKDEAMADDSGL